jgi:hypothetical protein
MDVNWDLVFEEIFTRIDGPKDSMFYYSGPEFLSRMRLVDRNTPDNPTLIAERRSAGKSTTRRDYFRDLFLGLSEIDRFKFTFVVVTDLETRMHMPCAEIRTLLGGGTVAPEVRVPSGVWSSDRLNEFLARMDTDLSLKHPERVLTLCYTCMEGFFKAYVFQNVPAEAGLTEITALAKVVREDLKKKNPSYPGEVFNVLTQAAYALNRVRDAFSESHFGGEADLWVAMYARDLVNTHIRLILHFM